jgi:hypothetical protein
MTPNRRFGKDHAQIQNYTSRRAGAFLDCAKKRVDTHPLPA